MSATAAKRQDSTDQAQHDGAGSQYLTFHLAGEEFAVDILRVQEIRPWTAVTRMPSTPDYLEGVLNLRGLIVPIIDLRTRLSLPRAEHDSTTVIIVLQVKHKDQYLMTGLVVDAVSDVQRVTAEQCRTAPDVGLEAGRRYVSDVAILDQRMVMLLNVDLLVDAAMLAAARDVAKDN